MQNIRVFSTEPAQHPDLTTMTQWQGWYDPAHPELLPQIGLDLASITCDALQAQPQGKRMLFLRGVLRYETYVQYGADWMFMYENGGAKLSRQIMLLRPLGRELRKRGIRLDGIWTDNEGGQGGWGLTQNQIAAVYNNPVIRAKMPPAVRALRPEMFSVSNANFRNAMITFNAYAQTLLYRSLSAVLVGAGIFCQPNTPGGPNVQPPTMNYNVTGPTWPVYDWNGWPWFSYMLDGKTSSPGLYLSNGGRYNSTIRNHRWQWNALIDAINHVRSTMHRANSLCWPVVTWPDYTNAWVWEQMIAHMVRTGVNWTAGGCGFIYWTDTGQMSNAVQDPIAAQIFNRHDIAAPVQRNLPEIPMDVDTITTAGYTTRYTDFLANVP